MRRTSAAGALLQFGEISSIGQELARSWLALERELLRAK